MASDDRRNNNDIVVSSRVVPRETEQALASLKDVERLGDGNWYLAGGTALALQCEHRQSVDLDFFHRTGEFSEQLLASEFDKRGGWVTDDVKEGTVYGTYQGAQVSFIAYPLFKPREKMHKLGTLAVLDARDIAVMKILAVSQRGRKRDFVDLYWYAQHREPLTEVIVRLPEQYPSVAHDFHHILRTFVYFEDAEPDPMPLIFFEATWEDMKRFFRHEVPKITRNVLSLPS